MSNLSPTHLTLNLLLSSSNSLKFFFNEIIFLDLLDRFFLTDHKTFMASKRLLLKFNVYLPFSNSLLKFKNKVYLILYFLLFELLSGVSPKVIPIYRMSSEAIVSDNKSTRLSTKRFKKLQSLPSSKLIDHFVFSASLLNKNFYSLLLLLHLFTSKHSYLPLTVPSKFIKISFHESANSFVSSINLNYGTGLFEFFSNFDEILNSKLKMSVFLRLDKVNSSLNLVSSNFILSYLLQALNFNVSGVFNSSTVLIRLPLNF